MRSAGRAAWIVDNETSYFQASWSIGGRRLDPDELAGANKTPLDQLAQRSAGAGEVDRQPQKVTMRIVVTSVFVNDQAKALRFYTDILGFEKKTDIPMGKHRWLTVTSPGEADGVELLLEPSDHPAAKPFQEALVRDGIPFTSFAVDDVESEHRRLVDLGVTFTQPPTKYGEVTTAVFDDTCGNLIQIAQKH
jgi:catechol 2,3-dioxygenase-like lactoylglutathione lyase family enzyme